jgi:hypothetical protein
MARSRRLGAVFVGALAVCALGALAACNGLIGLSDFQKGECSGARCDAGPLPDVDIPDASSSDAKPDAPKGAEPVSWARWKMPNYDGGAVALPNPPLYTPAGDEIVDEVTGLVWRAALVPGDFTVDQAASECAKLGPWRVPKRIELVTLLDFGRTSPPFIREVFNVQNVKVWTSSEVRPFTGGAAQPYWTVSFDTGVVAPQPGNLVAKVLCVKAK